MHVLSLKYGPRALELDRPAVMGILNITTDSFSDGGQFFDTDLAIEHAAQMLEAGADIIDVGGESTRPGADDVSAAEELDRVVPVIERLVSELAATVSVDTSKAAVMDASLQAGAFMINDVRALQEPGTLKLVAAAGCPVCLMHMQGEPRTMQNDPYYDDVVVEVGDFLHSRYSVSIDAGVEPSNIMLDPGFGFGKSVGHNLSLLKHLNRISRSGAAVLAGISRKRMFAAILESAEADRTVASVTAALLAVQNGAAVVRVHDVKPTVDALRVYQAMQGAVG